jgi:diaminopimelate epimerase
MSFSFIKMNGLGNDFVIVPDDEARFAPTPAQARAIARRGGPWGCDVIAAISRSERAHAALRFWNPDGAEVEHCGNAARCVAWLLMRALDLDQVRMDTPSGLLSARRESPWRVMIDMGEPRLDWREIPLSFQIDTREVRIPFDPGLGAPGCVSMGNPHVTFFVPDLAAVAVSEIGPRIENHWLFPRRVNVGFAQIEAPDRVRLRVWERGAGLTKACGTGACAALVAAHRRGLCGPDATFVLDGGELEISWRPADRHVLMTGPVSVEFSGHLPHLEHLA